MGKRKKSKLGKDWEDLIRSFPASSREAVRQIVAAMSRRDQRAFVDELRQEQSPSETADLVTPQDLQRIARTARRSYQRLGL